MFKPLLLLPAVLLLGTSGLVSAAPAGQVNPAGEKGAAKPGGEIPPHVKEIYKMDCAICHGATGDGKTDLAKDMALTLDDWTNPTVLSSKSDQDLYDIIRKGKDKMPPEDPARAKDAEVHSLVNYIRSLSTGHPVPAETTPPATPTTTTTASGSTTPGR